MYDNARVSGTSEVGSTASSYEVLAKLAVGGMAEIFLARGASVAGVSRYVVLKRILRHRAQDVNFVRMFLDEARLAAQLQHPNIAQVHDIGRLGDSYFFTMEYVHGETVRAVLQRAHHMRRPIPIGCVMTIVAGSAQGLHHAHERNGMDGRALDIVHRDVSPSNLMVSYEGSVKVVDFGVAKAADRVHETVSGTVKGKISYLSPEQCRGAKVDRRVDLFALGIVLWEMLTTERLFKRTSDFENMTSIVHDAVPPPSSKRADVPPELDALTLKLLAKKPADRYQSGEELVEALEAVAARCGFVLSTAALGRYMREVFGPKPEPWMVQAGPGAPEGVTVTSLPIPAELAVPPADSVDHALMHVADFSSPPSESFGAGSEAGGATGSGPPAATAPGRPPARVSAPPAEAAQASASAPDRTPVAKRRRVPLAAWILAPAVIIGVALGGLVSRRDGKAVGVDARASGPRLVAPPDAAAVAVAVPVDAGEAAPASVSADAEIAIASVDAAVRVAPAPAAAAKPVDPQRAGVAACRGHREGDARKWLAATAPSRRGAILVACTAAGITLGTAVTAAPPTPVVRADAGVDCAADPLACQH